MTQAANESALCIGCNYQLRDLTIQRCPECGRAFDPANRPVHVFALRLRQHGGWRLLFHFVSQSGSGFAYSVKSTGISGYYNEGSDGHLAGPWYWWTDD